jgi:hypothetical protein
MRRNCSRDRYNKKAGPKGPALHADELRGRISAVNSIFINASNQLGAVESGFVAALTNATFAVFSGGLGCLAVVGIVAARVPELPHWTRDTGDVHEIDLAGACAPVHSA